MKIFITWGSGDGPTEKAAFDAALFNAGIANYNLIPLSSVIPDNSEICVGKIDWNQKQHGYKLYVVLSYRIETRKDKESWSGVG